MGTARQSFGHAIGTGDLLDGRYLLGEELGRGAMGVVFEATHVLLARKVAVKLVRSEGELTAQAKARFSKEGQNLACVAHPHVVTVHDFGFSAGTPYLVMEHLQGESLDDRLRRTGPVDVAFACSVARQALSGLAAAHARGLVHRDLKPANIFLVRSADPWPIVKLIDFGLSTEAETKESRPRVAGTPSYLAPEQARGEPVDARADIYAFGATLYEALTGRPPLAAKNLPSLLAAIQLDMPEPPSRWRRDLPPEIDRLLLRALAKGRDDRFASAEAMLDAISDVPVGPASARRRYVLIADSDPATGEVCARAAASLGKNALVVRDGLEALEATRVRGLPELLVTKLSLPRMDGLALLGELRKEAGAATMPVLVASKFAAIRSAAWSAKDELGVTSILPDLADEQAVAGAMRAALLGERPPDTVPDRTMDLGRSEQRRLDKIRKLRLGDDRPPDAALQRLMKEVAAAFRVPVALVSIVLEDRQWFHAHFGVEGDMLAARGTERRWAFCSHVVEANERLVIPDAAAHPVFRDNPYVQDGLVRGYAGSPLVAPTGEVLGTLCIVDSERLTVSAEMLDALDELARRVAGELTSFGETVEDLGVHTPSAGIRVPSF